MVATRRKVEELEEETERRTARLLEQAESESRKSRAEVDTYVIQTLRNLDRELTSVLTSVRKGLDTLGATIQV